MLDSVRCVRRRTLGLTRRLRRPRSVAVLLHHTELDALLVVRQWRPPVWAAAVAAAEAGGGGPVDEAAGFTYELCAGLLDKAGASMEETASEEILEECGYAVPPDRLALIGAYASAIGISGSSQHIFFAEVDEGMKVGPAGGGGLAADGEAIEVLALPVDRAAAFVCDPEVPKSSGLMFAAQWLLRRLGR